MSSRYLCCLCDGFFCCAILTKIKKFRSWFRNQKKSAADFLIYVLMLKRLLLTVRVYSRTYPIALMNWFLGRSFMMKQALKRKKWLWIAWLNEFRSAEGIIWKLSLILTLSSLWRVLIRLRKRITPGTWMLLGVMNLI